MLNNSPGDGFAALHFIKTWSALYQGKPPVGDPTFGNFFLPAPEILSISCYTYELSRLSYLSLAFEPEFCDRRNKLIKQQTVRLDIDVPESFVDKIWASVRRENPVNNVHVGRGDAFSGYLIAALQGCFEKPVETLFQFVSVRPTPPLCLEPSCRNPSLPKKIDARPLRNLQWSKLVFSPFLSGECVCPVVNPDYHCAK